MALVAAGERVRASKLSPRIGTTVATASTGTFTAETLCDSITVPLIDGQVYKIVWATLMQSSVAADNARVRIREDSITGTQLQVFRIGLPVSGTGFPAFVYAEYTAAATGSKTFVGTGERASGTGNISRVASATSPTYLFVDLIG
jgi:hypothetical protein